MYTSRYTLLPKLDNASGPYIPLCNKLDLSVASRGFIFTTHFGKLRTLKKISKGLKFVTMLTHFEFFSQSAIFTHFEKQSK